MPIESFFAHGTVATEGTFYAPVGYSIWWPLLGVGLLLLCLGWVAWVLLFTRVRGFAEVPGFMAPRNTATVRNKYLALIDAIQFQYDAGTLQGRGAHLELSTAVRSFVHEMTGVKAQRMTLAELRQKQLPLVADAVAGFYPAEFAALGANGAEKDQLADSARVARNVVTSWR